MIQELNRSISLQIQSPLLEWNMKEHEGTKKYHAEVMKHPNHCLRIWLDAYRVYTYLFMFVNICYFDLQQTYKNSN